MRASQNYVPTLKETPHDAEIVSHQLMLRAGLIRKLGSGLYTWLPMGLRVLRHVERVVREEMVKIGALEVVMPAIQPAELWHETGRWETFGGQLLSMQDSNGRDYCFGPTHEEVITDLIRHDVRSYKQFPLTLFQIQVKFRDEIRPRFGVMRAREFIMKDAYSFHLNQGSLEHTYQRMYEAYTMIFQRLGLNHRAVEADTGAIGGAVSHEFQVLADTGEDILAYSDQSDYAANIEQATSLPPVRLLPRTTETLCTVSTPNLKTIDDVSRYLEISPKETVKTLIVEGTEHAWVALVLRGDDDINPIKAAKHPWIKSPLTFADEATLSALNLHKGFIGPVGLSLPVLADLNASVMPDFVCGANRLDEHLLHVSWERDATYQSTFDLRMVKEGDPSPDGRGTLQLRRGIEVGHIFQLGDKYTQAMNVAVQNEEGQMETPRMGCYGLGVTRVVAAAIEQHHDDRGIIWPEAMAPFQWVIIPLQRSENVQTLAEQLYAQFTEKNIDVLLEDRDERPGVLFADHDLLGIPHRLIVSERHLSEGNLEYKSRRTGAVHYVKIEDLFNFIHAVST